MTGTREANLKRAPDRRIAGSPDRRTAGSPQRIRRGVE
jgi:hypothetical protein